MKKLKYSLIALLLVINMDSYAQNAKTDAVVKAAGLKDSLKMSTNKFNEFMIRLRLFSDSVYLIMNSNETREKKQAQIQSVQLNKKEWLLQTLSPGQFISYVNYERSIMNLSPHKKMMDEQQNKLKQKGQKVEIKISQTL